MTNLSSLLAPVAAAALLVPASGCERSGHAQDRLPPPATAPAAAASSAEPDPVLAPEIAGDLRPAQAANLSFKIGGRLASVRIVRGEHVKKGQVLATLSDTEARATLAQADAAVQVARAQAAIAEDAETRAGQLGSADVIPASNVVAAKLTADAARAGVQQALAAASLARANVANHALTAPFDGVVVMVPDGTGETVGPGIPIMRLEQLDVLVLRATAPASEAASLKAGDEVEVAAPGGQRVKGKVRVVLGSLEPVSRRAPIEIELPNADGKLAAGSYVRAWLPASAAARESAR